MNRQDDDIAPEYDFPDLHRRAKELGREYKGILSESGRGMLRVMKETEESFRQMTGGGTTEQSLEIADEVLEDTTSSE